MNRQYGRLIGETIEKVVDVDVEVDGTGLGNFLQVKIEINLTKTLARERYQAKSRKVVDSHKIGKALKILFQLWKDTTWYRM